MGEQTRNMLIGVFVLISCILVVWLILFLRPTVGDGRQTLYVRFANINQINLGTRVLFAGKPIGEVATIQEISDARKTPLADVLGEIYCYQLVLKIDSSVRVYDTDEIAVQTSGLLGEKSIAIIPKVPPKGTSPKLVDNKPIYAQSVDPIEHAFTELSSLSKEMKTSFQLVSNWLQRNGGDLGDTVRSFGSAMGEVQTTAAEINSHALIGELHTAVHTLQTSIQEMQQGMVFSNAAIVMEQMRETSLNLNKVTQEIADGNGSLGQFITKEDFYLHLSGVLNKVETLMYDINHYGLLFHLNKSWQRQQRSPSVSAAEAP